jgi:hypothetical protein
LSFYTASSVIATKNLSVIESLLLRRRRGNLVFKGKYIIFFKRIEIATPAFGGLASMGIGF